MQICLIALFIRKIFCTADWLAELELSKVKKAGSKVFLSGFSEPELMQLARVL